VWAWCPQTANAGNAVTTFRPVSPQELQMTSEPAAPGASAIILYRDVFRDDNGRTSREDNYLRIKILTEEGRKRADIEIPLNKDEGVISNLHARMIKPDGTIVDFDGKVFTKSVVKARGVKVLAKTFTLPAIQVGCVIEYYYTVDFKEMVLFNSHWIVSDELFTKAADFSLKPYSNDSANNFRLRWTWENLPPGASQAKQGADGIVRLHLSNVPAFVPEDMMPPENEMKGRVDFTYSSEAPETNVSRFWAGVGKRWNGEMDSFVGKPKNMEHAVAEIVGPNDSPEVKLQKIYARVQQMRNTSYEVKKTEQEEKREKEKEPSNAEDAWKRGYANGFDLTWLYLALVRAAGFEAYGMMVPDRQNYFFDANLMQENRLDENIVLIKLNGKNIYCDPGAAYTPFGLLPWSETGVQGLQLGKKESVWAPSLVPTADQAATERRASLTLSETGDLEGKLTVNYTGIEAAHMRREERNADAAERKKYLEDAVKEYTSAASEVTLTNQPEWKNSAVPLEAEFSFKLPGWAAQAGHHVLVPVGLFGAREKHLFDHAERVHPIYIEYPYTESDDIEIQLPAGWKVSSLPPGWKDTGKVVTYTLAAQENNGKLHLSRSLAVNFVFLDTKYYPALRPYFQQIQTTDDEQVVVDPAAARAEN
jgi:Domain of Unknown Function with PDB structure (DUF3857)